MREDTGGRGYPHQKNPEMEGGRKVKRRVTDYCEKTPREEGSSDLGSSRGENERGIFKSAGKGDPRKGGSELRSNIFKGQI